MSNLEPCVIRVCDTDGNTRGTGFLVTGSLAVTCAHVVEMCGAGPGDRVHIVFHANGQEREAQVLPEYWQPPDKDDVAFLRLVPEGEPLPAGVTPAVLGTTDACHGHKMRVLGFPQLPGGYKEAYAEGELRGIVSHTNKRPMLQVDASPIYGGMSGAPVFDLMTQRVVGMMCEYLPDAPLEWATTTETLLAIDPDLMLVAPPGPVEPVPEKPLRIFQVQMADRHAEEGQMPPPLERFPAGTREVFLVFHYANMPPGQSLSASVYDSAAQQVAEWSDRYEKPAGVNSCLLPAFSGEFAPGDYRVEIRAGDQVAGEAHFTVQAPEAKVAPARPLRVFLCHSSSDKTAVRALYRRLRTDGVEPWLDEEDLLAGQKPQEEIPRAIRASDVVIVCLSKRAFTITGSVQNEIQLALDVAEEQPEGTNFLIPLRLEECRVPDRLGQRRPVDYFRRGGYERLLQALRKRAEDVGATIEEWAKSIERQMEVVSPFIAPSGISARDINIVFDDGTIITEAEQVILNQLLRGKLAASDEALAEIISLTRQLERLKSDLLSIQEKRAKLIDPRSAPPDLEEAERRTREEIARIESRLTELSAE